MKIEAVDPEIETVEFNESDTETIDTNDAGPSNALAVTPQSSKFPLSFIARSF